MHFCIFNIAVSTSCCTIQAAALYKFCHGSEKDASVYTMYMAARITVSYMYELPGLGKSVKYLSSLYAQAGYETALCSNYSVQWSNMSKAVGLDCCWS